MLNNSQHALKLPKNTSNNTSAISNDLGILCSDVMVLILHKILMKIDEDNFNTEIYLYVQR